MFIFYLIPSKNFPSKDDCQKNNAKIILRGIFHNIANVADI